MSVGFFVVVLWCVFDGFCLCVLALRECMWCVVVFCVACVCCVLYVCKCV